ncbi:hypothetical protein CPC08DRAFT_767168 [Agrocybe pediades]|nr:hypothetical protein CPC08DRAFT_767168 [Agrocybe pediades]
MSYPRNLEKIFINGELNVSLLMNFLFGAYTAVFCTTVYIYFKKEQGITTGALRRGIIVGSMSALYGATAVFVATQWLSLNPILCVHGNTGLSLCDDHDLAPWSFADGILDILGAIAPVCVYALADFLLLWRCWHVCGRQPFVLVVPFAFFVAEIVLGIAEVSFSAGIYFPSTVSTSTLVHQGRIIVGIQGGLHVSTAMATSLATFIICRRIYVETAHYHGTRKHYKHILDILIQSACTYTAFNVIMAILNIVTTRGDEVIMQTSYDMQLVTARNWLFNLGPMMAARHYNNPHGRSVSHQVSSEY